MNFFRTTDTTDTTDTTIWKPGLNFFRTTDTTDTTGTTIWKPGLRHWQIFMNWPQNFYFPTFSSAEHHQYPCIQADQCCTLQYGEDPNGSLRPKPMNNKTSEDLSMRRELSSSFGERPCTSQITVCGLRSKQKTMQYKNIPLTLITIKICRTKRPGKIKICNSYKGNKNASIYQIHMYKEKKRQGSGKIFKLWPSKGHNDSRVQFRVTIKCACARVTNLIGDWPWHDGKVL